MKSCWKLTTTLYIYSYTEHHMTIIIVVGNVLYFDTDVGVTEPGGHVMDDALVKWECSSTYHTCLWLELVPAVCCLHYISHPCILWQQIRVSNSNC